MPIFIDAHVHIYPEFLIDRFFAGALDNFSRAVANQGMDDSSIYVLALTEGRGCDVFEKLRQKAVGFEEATDKRNDSSSFTFHRTAESNSLIVRRGEQSLVLLAGRQIISKENIELLSLFSPVTIEDKTLALADLAQTVADNGGLPVVPWGVGKWFGARGKIVGQLLSANCNYPLFFADNGNRPSFWPEPALLHQAHELHIPRLSGSDPLPLSSHFNRPGSFGSWLPQGELSMQTPAASLRKLLEGVKADEIKDFGLLTGSFQFVIDQLRINLSKQFYRFSSSA